ncbi:hypothetical protein CPLU01_02352 [Colletotrichum plurivorum]|uniref:Capsule polysaccharide biosynthesis protein n=1 Tax=Colletotrichum plurivorum TaxID=2175906 RepID=A0A8H6KWI8_9PEZI|nr:hypothetical protein CPLU01_02352 [Colletotrichum plurivorum]
MSAKIIAQSFNESTCPSSFPILAGNYSLQEALHLPTISPSGLVFLLIPTSALLALLLTFLFLNKKSIPFIWHLRVLNAFRFTIRTLRPATPPRPSMIFQPMITSSSADLAETDFNLHKTNSSYFSDADIARAHLMSTLFAPAIEHMRGGTGAYTGAGRPLFGLALGAVSCSFRREISPGRKFDMWTRIIAWDEKWFYVATHFVRAGAGCPGQSSLYPDKAPRDGPRPFKADTDLYATALGRCVFKSGRKTVSPGDMLRMAGLVPDEVGKTAGLNEDIRDELRDVEENRQRGMNIVGNLSRQHQLALEAEFANGEGEVLGRHTDGTGVAGVVLTLLQLVGLRRKPYL